MAIMKRRLHRLREVEEMNVAVWKDGYDWLENNGEITQMYLVQTTAAVEAGYSPDEIFHHIIREAGSHRIEIAQRCRAAANYVLYLLKEDR